MNKSQITAEQRQALIATACDIRKHSHAPYSKFHVGAALLTATGEIIAGCNVENASYGLTICAERAAIFTAIAAGKRQWLAMAIATPGGFTPCGACRQVIAEFAPDLPILLVDGDNPGSVQETDMQTLLPGKFTLPT
jgi:cytidine deaminase